MSNHNENYQKDEHRKTVGEWLKKPFEWRIPVYQRHYAWDADNPDGPIYLLWKTVKEQTDARLKNEETPQHYFGAVLVDDKTNRSVPDGITRYDVVDGQQRLTTVQIALLALIEVAKKHNYEQNLRGALAKYVFSDESNQDARLRPTNFDKEQFEEILFRSYRDFRGSPRRENVSDENAGKSKIVAASEFFKRVCEDIVRENEDQYPAGTVIDAIKTTLIEGFDLVLIVLRESDEAQKVFESMNSVAEKLTTFDLIRNNVFYRAASEESGLDEKLFNKSEWQKLENPYWEKKADNRKVDGATHIQAYIARTLVAKMQREILFNRNSIFSAYKEFGMRHPSRVEEINSLAEHANIYQYLDTGTGKNPVKNGKFGIFRYTKWKNRDFYPVIFAIVNGDVDTVEKQRMIKLLESYVIRRGACGLSHGHYNKYAASICAKLGNIPDYKSLHGMLMEPEKNTTVFPDDERVKADCVEKAFYGSVFQRYVFEEIEKSLHSVGVEEIVAKEDALTIDHILPQKWEANPNWRKIVLGDDAAGHEAEIATVNAYLHTIGNLTLMSRKNNSAKSNHPIEEVQDMLADSSVKLNRDLAKEETWSAKKIVARSKEIAEIICKVWPYNIPDA